MLWGSTSTGVVRRCITDHGTMISAAERCESRPRRPSFAQGRARAAAHVTTLRAQ